MGDYYGEPEMAGVDPGGLARALVGDPAALGLIRTNFRTADPDALTPGNPFDVHTVPGGHLRWLVRPGPAAEVLAGLAAD